MTHEKKKKKLQVLAKRRYDIQLVKSNRSGLKKKNSSNGKFKTISEKKSNEFF